MLYEVITVFLVLHERRLVDVHHVAGLVHIERDVLAQFVITSYSIHYTKLYEFDELAHELFRADANINRDSLVIEQLVRVHVLG